MHASMNRMKARNAGFSLTELAIVMIIMALLIGGMMVPLSAQQEIRQNAETTRQLEEIREALLGFAITNGYFPCPAKSTSNGNEDRNSDTKECTGGKRYGLLPWITLGIKPNDSWGHLFVYSVSPKFSDQKITLNQSVTKPDITIRTRDAAGSLEDLSNKDDIPAVVLSTGKNGYWSWTLGLTVQNADSAGSNDDEDTNASATSDGKTFVSRTPTGPDAGVGEFDDLVTWVSPNVLFNRMVAANRLP